MLFIYFRDTQIAIVLGKRFWKSEWLWFLYRKSSKVPVARKLAARIVSNNRYKRSGQYRPKKKWIALSLGFVTLETFKLSHVILLTQSCRLLVLFVQGFVFLIAFELKREHLTHTWLATLAKTRPQSILQY